MSTRAVLLTLLLMFAAPIAGYVARGAFRMQRIHAAGAPTPSTLTELPPMRAPDPARPLAVLVAGADGTEITDLVPPHAVLAEAGFEVLVVAPERRAVPLVSGLLVDAGVDLVPDLSLRHYDEIVGRAPDVLVVPYVPRREGVDRALVPWIADHVDDHTIVLTVCAGSELVAEAGLLDRRRSSSHPRVIPQMREQYPDTAWIEGVRWVEDGNFVSSGGLSSGIDAALAVVRRVRGEREARRVAVHVGADPRFLDDPRFVAEPLSPITIAGLVTGDDRRAIGMRLEDGVDELALAATLDLVAVSMLAQPYTIASERRAYRSRHGLWLAPRVLDGERAIEIVPASDTPGYDGAIALLTPLLGALPAQVAGDALLWPARD